MRILAIRGCNLASLAGEFEIDLAHGPLGVAGVFAIVGPTGAGKSTLLDAMCVALFDRTPRLPGHSRVTVGHGEEDPLALGAQDPRTLLRRGASQGWAEVDFESGDSRRYRARWSVRRARGATHGNLQDQQISLVGLDAQSVIIERLGGTKTETLKAIHQRLGLTFDQFRRSALLAQGDFAAFLRAEGKDRSELLERMTGTEIYSKLSIAAHARAAAAEQMLRDRQGAALAIAVLADDARARAQADLVLAFAARDAARVRHAGAEKLAGWRVEARRREAALAQTAGELALAVTAAREAGPLRDQLVLVRRAEALRSTWDEATRLDRQHAIAQGELVTARDAARTAIESRGELAATHTRIAELHAPIRSARIAAGIVELELPRPPRDAGVETGAGGLFGISERVEVAEHRGHGALAAATWLVERRALSGELAAWPDLAAKLAQSRTLADGIATADRGLADRAVERAALAQKHLAAGIAFETAKQKLAQASRETESFVKRRTITPEAAGRAEDDARALCLDRDRLVATAAGARDAAKVLREHDSRLAELELAAVIDRDRGEAVTREREAAAVLRTERGRVVDELRKAAGYEHARAELVAGEPCPLCGAEDHPWKDRGAFDALIADAERVHGEAETTWSAATAVLAQLAARAAQRDTDRTRFASTRATALAAAQAHAVDWRAQLGALGELILVADPATPDAQQLAAERAEAARARLEAARAARSAAVAVEKAIGEAQAHRDVCLADVGHHDAFLRALDGDLATLDAAVERITVERDAKRDRHAELGRDLTAVVARWHAALPAPDRDAFAPVMPLDVAAPMAEIDAVDQIATQPVRTAAKRTRRKRDAEPAVTGVANAVDQRAQLTVPDHAVFERVVDGWRDRAAIVAQAEAELAAVLGELDRATLAVERAVADTGARRAETEKRVRELAAELAAATTALDDARLAAGFDRPELQRLLAEEPSRADAIAAQLDALDRAVDRARTRIAERRRLVADHEASRPGLATAMVADLERDADQVDALAAMVSAAADHAANLQASLAADDDARRRRDEALSMFAAAERAAEVDRVLGQVIGSHDGKLFRSFAQSLTLDQLLAVANAHLEELAPRYQLERVPKHDLELQVIDRDFGGEVRSVQSLSGGESFLVSLALALGLSSMSAHDVRVRTLLIDEGFGTLDPATLDSALAVLDELQATGRQVGVISHVPALLDRVRAHVRVTPRGGGRSDVFVPPN